MARFFNRLAGAGVVLAVAGLTVAACGDGDSSESDAADAATTTHSSPVVTIGLRDYAFDDVPDTIEVGTEIGVTNTSDQEIHELVAMRLPAGEERSVAELAALPPAELATLTRGEPALVLVAPPGDVGTTVVGDGTLDAPGRYLLACLIPTGADPHAYLDALATADGPPEVEGGAAHASRGMVAELTVT